MTRMTFDSLEYVRRLQEAGVERQTAEAHADLLRDMLWSDVAKTDDLERLETGLKSDMARLETELKSDMARLETELKSDMARLETELKSDMARLETGFKNELDHRLQELELRMTIKLGGMLAVMAGLIVTAQKLL